MALTAATAVLSINTVITSSPGLPNRMVASTGGSPSITTLNPSGSLHCGSSASLLMVQQMASSTTGRPLR